MNSVLAAIRLFRPVNLLLGALAGAGSAALVDALDQVVLLI